MAYNDHGIAGRNPIDELVIDFEMPKELAYCLIGKTEDETEENIMAMKSYLQELIAKIRYVTGLPISTMGGEMKKETEDVT